VNERRARRTVLAGLLVVLAGVAGVPRAGSAQDPGSLTGRVVSYADRQPIAGARVTVAGTGDTAVTDAEGLFRFGDIPAGSHVLHIEYLSMRSRDIPIELDARRPSSLEVALRMSVIPVAELVVTVDHTLPVNKLYDFYRRMEHGQGYFFTRADVLRRRPARITDLLLGVPGIDVGAHRIGRISVTMGRRKGCVPEYYVDGARAPHFDLDDLQPSDLAGLEIYRGNSEVPLEFKAFERCGAIIVWTREPGSGR
jgi:TonB-dependent starch-binding outer membrane protein SusC